MNKVVSVLSVAGFILRVKSASTEQLLFQVTTKNTGSTELAAIPKVTCSWDIVNNTVEFNLTTAQTKKLKIGEYYKVQIAYIEEVTNEIGYYSSIAIVKYTGRPTVSIAGFDKDTANENTGTILGKYYNESDQTEKDYEYRFILYKADKSTVLDDTGWKTHIAANDVPVQLSDNKQILEQIDEYTVKYILDNQASYFIRYFVKTNNEIYVKSPYYELVEAGAMNSTLKANLIAELDYDNGCVVLKLIPYAGIKDTIIVGSFEIGRASSLEDYKIWTIINAFNMNGHLLESGRIFTDLTIEHGQTYKYAIRQKNSNGIYSAWVPITKWRQRREDDVQAFLELSDDWNYNPYVVANFEDAFLYDGKKQLKIRFNPKVSSFKTVLSDTKKTAIGNQYPYFFRNGIVAYKEFQISGLISYLSDQDEFFLSRTKDLGMPDTWQDTTDIIDENIIYERRFKLTVLDWLNEDNIKLFRSPGEGNYLVRLSNVSLTPNDSLSRMIHTFNCTATEIKELTTDALIEEDFLSAQDLNHEQMLFLTMVLENNTTNANSDYTFGAEEDLFYGLPGYYIKLEDFMPGTEFMLGTSSFIIGQTGQYEARFDVPVAGLSFSQQAVDMNKRYGYQPSVTVGIKSKGFTSFDLVTKVQGKKRTFISVSGPNENILKPYFDIKHQIERLYYVQLMPKQLIDMDISLDALQAYVNKANSRDNKLIDIDINAIYRFNVNESALAFLNTIKESGMYRCTADDLPTAADSYPNGIYIGIEYDNSKGYIFTIDTEYSTQVVFGKKQSFTRDTYGFVTPVFTDNVIDVSHTDMLDYAYLDYIPVDENYEPYIKIGNAVMINFGLYQKIITYDMEEDRIQIKGNKSVFINQQKAYNTALTNFEGTSDQDYKNSALYRCYIAGTISTSTYNTLKLAYETAKDTYMQAVENQLTLRQEEAHA